MFFATDFSERSDSFKPSSSYQIIEAKINEAKRIIEAKFNEDFTIIIEGSIAGNTANRSDIQVYTNSINGQTHDFSVAAIYDVLK